MLRDNCTWDSSPLDYIKQLGWLPVRKLSPFEIFQRRFSRVHSQPFEFFFFFSRSGRAFQNNSLALQMKYDPVNRACCLACDPNLPWRNELKVNEQNSDPNVSFLSENSLHLTFFHSHFSGLQPAVRNL